jgi:hypothetical protein
MYVDSRGKESDLSSKSGGIIHYPSVVVYIEVTFEYLANIYSF